MARTPYRIAGALSVRTATGTLGSKRWMDLLASVGDTESITAAAKAVGLTYKAAWDAIDAMNNLSDRPLVERSVGGKGGGATRLTARGRQLVDTFRKVEAEHARYIESLNARVKGDARNLGVLGRFTMLTSARNQFAGKVSRIKTGAVNDEVLVKLSGGDEIVSVVTRESVENLGLEVGSRVVALVKASSVIVGIEDDRPMRISARNRLVGTIDRLATGAVNTEVVIALRGGNTVAAIITNGAAEALSLAEGMAATALFKASSVILGVSA
jgi:molybdate transport system regulatory protein